MRSLPLVGLIVGAPTVYFGFLSLRSFFRIERRLIVRAVLVLIGCTCAFGLFAIGEYRPSPTERYFGLPFFSLAFMKEAVI